MSGVGNRGNLFLRGIETDLRALCQDARRRNQPVKAAAEAVILQLKEADDDAALLRAADAAARAFSSACDVPPPDAGNATINTCKRLTARSIACMHKMLTHTVVSPACLLSVLTAVERVGVASFDDNITLKVLQANISLLTVRMYARALNERELARAFALFFKMRTAELPLAVATEAVAAGATTPRPLGVIETTARAAFRQVAAELFNSANDTQRQGSEPVTALDSCTIEVRASYRLFQDLCALLGDEPLLWLSQEGQSEPKHFKDLPAVLILEVVDDALSNNVDLFRRHPLFSDLVSKALAPVILKLQLDHADKSHLKAQLSLTATVIRNFSEEIGDSCRALLLKLTDIIGDAVKSNKGTTPGASAGPGWTAIFATEALRVIFAGENGPKRYCQFILAHDLAPEASPVVWSVLKAITEILDLHGQVELLGIPLNPMLDDAKPFARMPLDSYEVLVSIALGLFISFGKGVQYATDHEDFDAVRVFTASEFSSRLVSNGAETTMRVPIPPPGTSAHVVRNWKEALHNLTDVLRAYGIASYTTRVAECLDQTLTSLSSACVLSLKQLSTLPEQTAFKNGENTCGSHRTLCAYSAMFSIQEQCGERLGRNWGIVLNALVALDEKLFAGLTPTELAAAAENGNEFYLELKNWLERAFARAHKLSWNAIQELISALVHSSRAAIQVLSKRPAEDAAKSDVPILRMFGITWAEAVVSSVITHSDEREDAMPQGLWELLTGHHVSICVDSGVEYLRTTALKSMSRVASVALACETPGFVPHGKVISPFMDLLQSPYSVTRSDILDSLRLLLQTHGDKVKGIAAWGTVLSILRSACGHLDDETEDGETKPVHIVSGSESMVSDGFRVVQLIADDFLPCLVQDVLPRWVYVLGGYGRQTEDVNVALTSIGLLWSTADFLATDEGLRSNDMLWITLFSELKDIGHDERPEIRNCAVKTLTGTLKAQAANLSASAWEGIIASSLLPLLERVMRGGESVNEKVADEGSVAVKSKVDQQLIVHHSRNTPRKQWNETRVLALRGVASVLCIAIPLLAELRYENGKPVLSLLAENDNNSLWAKVLQFAGTAAASQDTEVAVAGVASLLDLLDATGKAVSKGISNSAAEGLTNEESEQPPVQETRSWISGIISGSDDSPPAEKKESNDVSKEKVAPPPDGSMQLWESVWLTISSSTKYEEDENVRATSRNTKITDDKALVLLGEGLSEAKTHFDPALSHKSSPFLLQVLFHLVTNMNTEATPEEHYLGQAGKLSDVALSALKTIRSIRFGDDADSWKCLLKELCKVLDDHSSDGRAPVATFHVVTIIKGIYSSKDRVPVNVLNNSLLGTVVALGRIMTERHRGTSPIAPEDNEAMVDFVVHDGLALWSAATIAFETCMHTIDGFLNAPSSFWDSICQVIDDFLYPTFAASLGGWGEPIPFGARPQAQEYDILLARCIRDFLPFLHASTLAKTRENLVELLARGAEEGKTSRRPRFVRACQEYIFNLADQRWVEGRGGLATNDIANICARKVTQVSDEILQQFIADGQRSGRCPLPADRRAEVMFLMRKLKNLQAFVSDPSGDGKAAKRHMLTLYPRLAECVDVGDIAVRNFARALIDESTFKHHIMQQMPVI